MYLSIGNDMALREISVIGIFDLDTTSTSKRTLAFLAAAEAEAIACRNRSEWEEKRATAEATADEILREATDLAQRRAAQIVENADEKAAGIIRRAESEAELERKKATEGIKREIVDVSSALAGKMVGREIDPEDHRDLIDSFIDKIGDSNGGDQ